MFLIKRNKFIKIFYYEHQENTYSEGTGNISNFLNRPFQELL